MDFIVADDMSSVLAKLQETGRVLAWQSEEGPYSHICFSRWQQIALFRRFPDVVNVDGTHASNRFGYRLYTFLITDGMSIGRPVMYAFVESEQFALMRRLFGLLKEMMGEQCPLGTFVMDKLAAQMWAARIVFGCDVLLCYFHIRKSIRKHDPRFVSYLTTRWLYITRKWAVHPQSGMFHFGHMTNNRLEDANGRLKDRVRHADTLGHAIQKVSRHADWPMREFEMHTSYHCDRRQILEGDGYVLNVVCRMTTYACSLVLRHLGPRPPRPYDSVGTNRLASQSINDGCRITTYRKKMYLLHLQSTLWSGNHENVAAFEKSIPLCEYRATPGDVTISPTSSSSTDIQKINGKCCMTIECTVFVLDNFDELVYNLLPDKSSVYNVCSKRPIEQPFFQGTQALFDALPGEELLPQPIPDSSLVLTKVSVAIPISETTCAAFPNHFRIKMDVAYQTVHAHIVTLPYRTSVYMLCLPMLPDAGIEAILSSTLLAENLPSPFGHRLPRRNYERPLNNLVFTDEDILQLLHKINPFCALGPDGAHPRILKETFYLLFRQSLDEVQNTVGRIFMRVLLLASLPTGDENVKSRAPTFLRLCLSSERQHDKNKTNTRNLSESLHPVYQSVKLVNKGLQSVIHYKELNSKLDVIRAFQELVLALIPEVVRILRKSFTGEVIR
ncbi:hypothetical protein CLF_105452 [Clonorchis sinensis]|uniref:ZSWIM1/3 RNaseH-like domain-containing protein n=1 Tax=Clonorchis sinensis TaxID=79923 RepID=G7YDJ0_CLOSI|nr:hypothetical protein CLF_105452 [Clonorchis sinensis]